MKCFGLAGLVMAAAVICFFLPWLVPPLQDGSESAALGFSNLVFMASIVGIFIPAVFWAGLRLPAARGNSEAPTRNKLLAPFESPLLETTAWMLFLAVSILLVAANSHPESYFPGESDYILRRAVLLARGQLPYRDFEYAYGPMFIQSLAWLHSGGLSLHLANALLVIAESLIGLLSVRYMLADIFRRDRRKSYLVFLLLALTACNLICAFESQSYTYFRYASPIAFAYLVLNRFGTSRVAVAAWAGPLHGFGWWISPEVGLAVACAFVIVFVLRTPDRPRALAVAIASLLLCTWILPGYGDSYRTLWEFARGAGTPIFTSKALFILFGFIGAATLLMGPRLDATRPPLQFLYLVSLGTLPGLANQFFYNHIPYAFGVILLTSRYLLGLNLPGRYALLLPLVLCLSTLEFFQLNLTTFIIERSRLALAALGTRTTEDGLRKYLTPLPKEFSERVIEGRRELLGKFSPGPYLFITPYVYFDAAPAHYSQDIQNTYFTDTINVFSHAAHTRSMEDLRGKRVVFRKEEWEAFKDQSDKPVVYESRLLKLLNRTHVSDKLTSHHFRAFVQQNFRESDVKAPDGFVYIDIPDIEYRPPSAPKP